jgi:hypothetical protein
MTIGVMPCVYISAFSAINSARALGVGNYSVANVIIGMMFSGSIFAYIFIEPAYSFLKKKLNIYKLYRLRVKGEEEIRIIRSNKPDWKKLHEIARAQIRREENE